MATKLQFYSAIAENTINDLTAKRGNWTRFLDSAAWHYKYPFQDQLMIHAQRPDATACAELELWNEQFNRWVRRGSKGIALIDDSGSYPRLKYVFDVSDTEPSLYRARPVKLWEMRQEHKSPVLAELAKNYEDVSADDSLADAFHNIAEQLAREYYEDNYREIYYRSENSALEPSVSYDFEGAPIEQGDDGILRAMFEKMLANSIAYTVMARCGLDPGEYFDEEDFQSVTDFNTPDMVNALGVAASDLSEQVLRDIEITIRKYERIHAAERSENNHDRNPNVHAGRGLSASRHQTERAAEGIDGAARQVRENEENIPQRTQVDNIQPPAAHGEAISASAGSGRIGDGTARTGDERADGAERTARQGERPVGVDSGNERLESAGRGNGLERTDIQLDGQTQGAAEEAAPFSMAELAFYHSDWNERLVNGVVSDETVLDAALSGDKENTITAVNVVIDRICGAIVNEILDSTTIEKKVELFNELELYFSKDRKPPLEQQLYDSVIRSDVYKERLASRETPPQEQETLAADGVITADEAPAQSYSQLGNSFIKELLSTSPISMDEVDSILRDGGNFDSHKLNIAPYNSRSALRIAAHFAKNLDDNAEFLKREYLTGRYGRSFSESGKGFDFGNHRVCAWYTAEGIELAIGTTAKNNIHKVTIPWENAAARIDELMREGRYISTEAFEAALDNERSELADRLWFFYRDNMGNIPDDFNAEKGGHPGDHALIKSLLEDDNERQRIFERLETDVETWENDPELQTWRASVNCDRLLGEMRDAMQPPVFLPNGNFEYNKSFSYFITQDEIDAELTHGSPFSEGKYRVLSYFLGDHSDKEKADFIKHEHGLGGGGTRGAINGWEDHSPSAGITLKRGDISKPDAEVNLKWNAVAKRIEKLMNDGQYVTRAELDSVPSYERLMLVRKVNYFYYNLPEEYERPFPGKTGIYVNEYRNDDGEKTLDFHYPHEAEWQAVSDLLDNPERVDTVLAQMRYIFENTSTDDRYYDSRKEGFEALSAYKDGTYTLFPGIENLPEPGTPVFRRIESSQTPRREMVEDLREPSLDSFQTGIPQTAEQLSLFNFGDVPVFPTVEEQRVRIDQKLQQETEQQAIEAEVKTPALSLSDDADAPFLNISDEDKARLAVQFTDNPRSREAVNLVREIYGDTLGMPIPQAVKRITELAAEGRFTVAAPSLDEQIRAELSERGFAVSDELIEDGINDYNAHGGKGDFQDIADFIEDEYLTEESAERDVPQYEIGNRLTYNGKPHEIDRIGDFVRLHNLGTPSAYPIFDYVSVPKDNFERMLADGELTIEPPEAAAEPTEPGKPHYNVGDTVYLEGGKPFVITRISEFSGEVQLQDPSLLYPIFRAESKEQFEWLLSMYTGNEQFLAPVEEIPSDALTNTDETVYFTNENKIPYRVGSTIDVPAGHGTRATIQIDLVDDNLVHYTILDGQHEKERGSMERERFEGFVDSKRYSIISDEPEPEKDAPVELDFDTVAQTALERVMADADYTEALTNAKTRASLRNPCTWALEQSIRDHEQDEPEVYRRYFGDDDFNDNLFDFVLKQSWEQRPQPAAVTEQPASEQSASPYKMGDTFYMDDGKPYIIKWIGFHEISYQSPDTPHISKLMEKADFEALLRDNPLNKHLSLYEDGFTEITDPAELAEIEAIFGDGKPKPSYIVGQRVVLDLHEHLSHLVPPHEAQSAGEFIVDAVNADNVTLSITYKTDGSDAQDRKFTTSLTAAEVDRYTVQPVAENLYEELSSSGIDTTAYYLFQYPNGIDAGAVLSHETLSLIKESADKYVICAEACFLAAEEMEQYGIEFRKMPRDWNLLPNAVKEQIRAVRPEYELQWLESTQYQRGFEDWQKAQEPEQKPAPAVIPAKNFRITDDHLGEGGAKTKFRNNLKALQTLKDIEFENRAATPEEQEILSRYVGWGGIQEAFDPKNKAWEDEYLELNALLTPEEWESARSTTLYAHYTSPLVIKAIYETVERMGFKTGNILEPACGIGNFFGLLPESMRDSKLYGVEIDSITARIAKQLYPNADIKQTGFENTQYSDAFFDVAVGNVPFGGFGVIDKRYKTNFQIHDYFFQKTLDKVRPGGIVAFITSKGTLDKKNPEVRKYLAQRAELLGAVRLPNNAFLKNAGTEVTTDILFFQKRDRPLDIEPEWVHLGLTEDGLPINRYFLDNPEMMLGTMTNGAGTRMYGNENSTTCIPIEGADLAEQLKTALSYIQGQYTVEELDDLDGVDDHAIPADPNVKNFSYTKVDGTVYFRENSLMYPVDLPAMTLNRIRGMIELRECVNKLIALQLDDYSDEEIKAQQAVLNTLYDGFIAEFGLISTQVNSRAFNADSSYYLLSALEVLDEDGELARKADMFTKRTVKQRTVITHVDTASEALAVSLGEKACVDIEYMAGLTGFTTEKLIQDLEGVIFFDFGNPNRDLPNYDPKKMKLYEKFPLVTADEYLSGNVREKLAKAVRFNEVVGDEIDGFNTVVNITALTAIQPKDLEAGEIAVRLGSTWIEPEYVQQFMYELLNTSWRNQNIYQVKYHQYTGEWQVTGKNKSQFSDIPATVTYGTERMNAYQILDDTLNLRDVRVYDYKEDADGKERRVLNKKQTMLAQQKQELIKQKFRDWIWQDPERRQTLVRKYNDLFNSMRPREYDGSHITFDGMNPEIKLSKHQVDGAARHLYGGNALYAHVVGAGKTFTMIAAAMESKRLGLCQKSLFAVPNHLTEQWATEFLRLYPSANILVATKKDFEMRNRKKFCAKIATGDYDAVIIGHTQMEKIPMSRERQEAQIREQIWEIEQGICELKETNGERYSIKQLEKTKRGLENRLIKLLDSKRRDDVVTFEQLGVDRLYVDEAHGFKNLFLYTKMRNVAGLSTSEAQKSSDLFMKCRYMDELTGNKGVIFATGTPISNSMSEMYTMQRYLQYDTLSAKNLTHFDCWLRT